MLKMPNVAMIRDLSMRGKSKTMICKETGCTFKTVSKYLEQNDFSTPVKVVKHRPTKLDPYKDEIEKLLLTNKKNWYKQHLTGKRLFTILKNNHPELEVSYSAFTRYLKRIRDEEHREVGQDYSRLVWHPGEAQADFGEADFKTYNGEIKRYKFFVLSFPYSNIAFTQIFCGENVECVCQALINLFEQIGCIPNRIVFDNATGIGRRICNVLYENEIFMRFRTHYHFFASFANPQAGHEKGNVESNVGYIRRNLYTPLITLPQDIESFNTGKLFSLCNSLMDTRMHYIKKFPVTKLFEDDKQVMSALPSKAFKAIRQFPVKVNGYSEVVLEKKHLYKLGHVYRHKSVIVVTSAWKVQVYDVNGNFIESFDRQYGNERTETASLRTTINTVINKPNSWYNSRLRQGLGDTNLLVQYIDSQKENKHVSHIFREIKKTLELYDFDMALHAAEQLIETRQKLTTSNLIMFCSRLQTGSPDLCINSTGVDLNQYNLLMSSKNELGTTTQSTKTLAEVAL